MVSHHWLRASVLFVLDFFCYKVRLAFFLVQTDTNNIFVFEYGSTTNSKSGVDLWGVAKFVIKEVQECLRGWLWATLPEVPRGWNARQNDGLPTLLRRWSRSQQGERWNSLASVEVLQKSIFAVFSPVNLEQVWSKGDWEETVDLVACALEVLGRDALGKCRVLLTMRYKIIVVSWILFLAWQTLCLFGCLWIRRGDGHPPLCSYIPSGRVLQNLYSFPWKSIRNQEVVWIFMDFPWDFHGIFPWDFLQTKPVDPSMGIFLDAVVGFLDFDRSVAILPKAVPRDHGPKPGWMRGVRLYYEQWNRGP